METNKSIQMPYSKERRNIVVGLSVGLLAFLSGFPFKATKVSAANETIYYPVDYGAQLNTPNFDNAPIINNLINNMPPSGGVIELPAGEMWIHSPIKINRSYVTIRGVNAGTRSHVDNEEQPGLNHPGGGSKLILGTNCQTGIVSEKRVGAPRVSSIQLENFLIQGRGTGKGQIAVNIEHDNDAVRIIGVSIIAVGMGLRSVGADAFTVRGCWISEVHDGLHSLGSSQQLLVANNYFGAQPGGRSIYLENPNWANIVGNNIYPDGHVCLEAKGAQNCTFTGNNIQSYYTGAVIIKGDGNLFSGKVQALRSSGNWLQDPIGRDGLYGLIHVDGNDNHITASSINSDQPETHTRILIMGGNGNWVTNTKIYGRSSNRKVVVNGSCVDTRIVHSASSLDVDKANSNTTIVW
ncbi:NosD domain-containing protein [Neobacillus sp. NPDC093182]|uniref:NosD domain-containing protein n=1 Tax=Neobacillus sp. NPDC093182 TaxID=3364297 RepID=UPI00381005C9